MSKMRLTYHIIALLYLCFNPFNGQAQISENLYKLLPDSLRPADRSSLTIKEAQNIMQKAFEIDAFGRHEYSETDSLCYLFAPKYKTIKDDRSRLDFLFFVVNYLYSSYAVHTSSKTSLKNASDKYQSPHTEIGLKYSRLYLDDYSRHPVQHIIWMCNILMMKAHFQMEADLYKEAFTTLQELKDIARSVKNVQLEVVAQNALSFLFESLFLADEAIVYSDSSYKMVKLLPASDEWAAGIRINILQTRQKLFFEKLKATGNEQYSDSVLAIHRTIKMKSNNNLTLFESSSYVTVALVNYYYQQYDKAITNIDSAIKIYPEFSNTAMNEQATAARGLSLIKLGKEAEGIELLRSLHFNTSIGSSLLMVLEELYQHEMKNNNLEKALEYLNFIIQYKDRKHSRDMQGKALEMEQFYNVKARESQIAQLKQLQTRNGFIALFVGIAILLILGIIMIRYRAARARTNDLVKKIDEAMEMQVVQVDAARDTERKLLGQQLHDDLSSTMAATIGYLRMLSDKEIDVKTKEQSRMMSELLEESYNKARNKSHELFLEENTNNFWKRLSEQVELLFSGTSITFEFNGDISGVILSPDLKTALIMVLKEGITNIIKHSRASKAEILLYYEKDLLVLEMNDNGRGFTQQTATKSVGLKSIKERINQHNGTFELTSSKKIGTIMVVKIPLPTVY
jgi:signal transduction histidine kinase